MYAVWFLIIVREGIADENDYDESGHCVIQGSSFTEVRYLEYQGRRNGRVFKEMEREEKSFLSIQGGISSCKLFTPSKNEIYHISNSDFCSIIST